MPSPLRPAGWHAARPDWRSPEATHGSRLLREGGLTTRLRHQYALWPLARRAYGRADALVAVSRGVAEDLAARLGVAEDNIHVVPNPVCTERLNRLSACPPTHPWLRLDAPKVIIAVGSLRKVKGFDALIRAFGRLRESVNARLIIYGEGPQRSNLTDLRDALNLRLDVDLPGYAANPYAAMSAASLLVLSSVREGSPNVLVEALACGCPVVATDCESGPAEILEGGEYGRLCPVGDAEALALAMQTSLEEKIDGNQLRQRAQQYNSRRSARRFLEILGLADACPTEASRNTSSLRQAA